MGNCLHPPETLTAEIVPHDGVTAYPAVRLRGSPESVLSAYIRFAILHEAAPPSLVSSAGTSSAPAPASGRGFNREIPVTLQTGSQAVSRAANDYVTSTRKLPAPSGGGRSEPEIPVTLRGGSECGLGSRAALLRFIDARFPMLSAAESGEASEEGTTSLVARVTRLQHESMTWHMDRMVRWAEDLTTRGGRKGVDPKMGNWKMEVSKFGRSYSQLLEVMMEHAQMEEKVLFPILDGADRGLSKVAKEEHARDLPIMNGIKEIIKSVEVLDSRSPNYKEALYNLFTRLKSLQGQCKQHFMEEEVELLPLMEAVELSKEQDESALEQCFDVMQGTHRRLLKFLLEGLPSHDAMKYLDLISKCRDKERMESMLKMIIE